MRNYDFQMASIELTPQSLGQYSAVLIVTDHSNINYADVVRHARLVVDTRNATRDVTVHRDKIVRC